MANVKGKRQAATPKCRGCGKPRSGDRKQYVKVGGYRYHPECAEAKPKAHQKWENGEWVRL